MTFHAIEHSPKAILHRLVLILNKLLALRQVVQHMDEAKASEDLVTALAGSLGPAAPDEMTYFNQFDVTWQRFTKRWIYDN
ncbi:MAG: hypothetical protein R3A44_32460 [Caldilineaceae bacterium]